MANGTIALTRTGSGYLTGQILWSSTGNGSEENSSTVTAKLQLQRSALNSTTGTFKGTFTVGSTSKTISWYGTLPSYEWVTVETITATISHNGDGNGSCYLYALINGPTQTTMEGTSVSGSSTVTLDQIPRYASIISATDFTDEGNPSITYSNPAATAVSLLQACISLDGSSADVPYRDIPKTGTKYTFSLTEAERNTLRAASPNSNTLSVRFYVRSKIGDSKKLAYVHSKMTIVNADPTVSATAVDTNSTITALTGNSSILVALHSKAKVTINAAAQKYAAIKSKKVTHGTASLSGDGTLSVTNHPIKISVTDSRGNTTTQNASNTIVPYLNPTCSIGNNLPEAGGAFSLVVTGLFYNGAIGKTTNVLTVQYRYKAAGGSYGNWTPFSSVSKNGNKYTAKANLTGLDYQTVYTFQARVIDSIHTSGITSAAKAVISEPVFDWGQNDFRFNVPVDLKDGCEIRKNGKTAYAPSGHGLGSTSWINTSEDIDTVKLTGVYSFQSENTSPNKPFDMGELIAINRTDNVGTQIAIDDQYGDTRMQIRKRSGGTWQAWEHINPPLTPGVEYRTPERYNGKPVYAKLVNFGAMPAETNKNVAHATSVDQTIISLQGCLSNGVPFSTGYHHCRSTPTGKFWVDATTWSIRILTESDMSAVTATVFVKYIK